MRDIQAYYDQHVWSPFQPERIRYSIIRDQNGR